MLGPCVFSPPGKAPQRRAAAKHASRAQAKVEDGQNKEAIREYQALFQAAAALGTPWARNYTTPAGLALCRLWARVVREDRDVSPPTVPGDHRSQVSCG